LAVRHPRHSEEGAPPEDFEMTDIAAMDASELAFALESYARESGFEPQQAYYITGDFNLKDAEGASVYSDPGHLWCECCADKLLKRAKAILPEEKWEDHEVWATEPSGEDTCPHCMDCGETLDGTVSDYCVQEELAHYMDNPIDPEDEVNPRMAVELAQVISAAYGEAVEGALALGRSAIVAIARAREAAPAVPA
jgi:hypothetical protein